MGPQIKVVFLSVIIKSRSIGDRYKGGTKAFKAKYPESIFQDGLAVVASMSGGEFSEIILELEHSGLVKGKDFAGGEAFNGEVFACPGITFTCNAQSFYPEWYAALESESAAAEPNKTILLVRPNGTVVSRDYKQRLSRGFLYKNQLGDWFQSTSGLIEAIRRSHPLQDLVALVYVDERNAMESRVEYLESAGEGQADEASLLRNELHVMCSRPERYDLIAWLNVVSDSFFNDTLVPAIRKWADEEPIVKDEYQFIPVEITAEGSAFTHLAELGAETLSDIGVSLISANSVNKVLPHAKLDIPIAEANAKALARGLCLVFGDLFIHEARLILETNPGLGSFKETFTLPSGEPKTFSFPLAVGMASQHAAAKYKKKFDVLPTWFKYCHPSHRISLIRLAEEFDSRLPDSFDAER